MSLRRKACSACVQTKRRCDLALPACRRCTEKSLHCQYPNTPLPSNSRTSSRLGNRPSTEGLSSNTLAPTLEADSGTVLHDSHSGLSNVTDAPTSNEVVFQDRENLDVWNTELDLDLLTDLTQPGGGENDRDTVQEEVFRDESISYAPLDDQQHGQHYFVEHSEFSQNTTNFQTEPTHPLLPMIPMSLTTTATWPGKENETWRFCASELLSYIGLFAKTASTPFIRQSDSPDSVNLSYLHPSLQRALGVCAMYTLNGKDDNQLSTQLLTLELNQLIESSRSFVSPGSDYSYAATDLGTGRDASAYVFRQELARLQAVTLYQIVRYFNNDPNQRSLAEQQEPLIVSWTTSLQLRLQTLGQRSARSVQPSVIEQPDDSFSSIQQIESGGLLEPADTSQGRPAPYDAKAVQHEEIENAYRTILMSYFVRGVYSFLKLGFCPFLPELSELRIHLPPYVQGVYNKISGPWSILPITYGELADMWSYGSILGTRPEDRFIRLLLVACKGLSILQV